MPKIVPLARRGAIMYAALVGFTMLAAALNTAPVFAQQSVHAETTVNFTSSNTTFGPVSGSCDATNGGAGCKFLSFDFKGTCETREEGRHVNVSKCTISGSPTILLSFSPSGAHDQSGNPTGVCVPFFESFMRTYEDGSVLEFNGQGTACCAEDSCEGLGFGPPLVFRESTIITGGTGRFMSVKGNGADTGAQYSDGTGIAQEEEVWVFSRAGDARL
jgi:hypothetical protein